MPILDKNRIYDGWISLEGGVDAGRDANVLEPNKCTSAQNITFRGGKPTTRPGFKLINIDPTPRPGFPTGDFSNGNHWYDGYGNDAGDQNPPVHYASSYQFKYGIMQSAIVYNPHTGADCIMAMIAGILYRITPGITSARVDEIVMPKRNRNNITLAYLEQADKWFIAQDGESAPIIFDGATARRSNLATSQDKTEIPVGTITSYGMGRICVVVQDRNIAFGDLYGSHLDTQTDPADSIILFTERTFLSEGFDAAIPFEQGVVTGLEFPPQLDTSTGQGELLAFSEIGANSFMLSLDRTTWKTSQFQMAALDSTGMRGHRSGSFANEDLWFRSDDGVRSFRQARSEQYGYGHLPMSTNVRQYMSNDTNSILKFASSIYIDNRVLFTVSPMPNAIRPTHAGMVVVDFDILSSFGANQKPAWDGYWSFPNGVTIVQLLEGRFNGVQRAFAFGIDSSGQNQLYEITLDSIDDVMSYTPSSAPKPGMQPGLLPVDQEVPWELITRALDFSKTSQSSTQYNENSLYDADLWLKNIADVDMPLQVYYRPDDYPFWIPWRSFSQRIGLIGVPGSLDMGGIPTARLGFVPRLSFGKPRKTCDPTSGRDLRRGYEFQIKLNGVGHATLNKFRLHAQHEVEQSTSKC